MEMVYYLETVAFKDHPNRFQHTLGVRNLALLLAKKFGLDEEIVEVAAILHDVTKYMPLDEQIKWINDSNIVSKFKDAKAIYHAYSAANFVQDKFNIHDERIINMIRYHVYGRIGMSIYEQIMVFADYAEETRPYPDCIEARRILLEEDDFGKAMVYCISSMIKNLEKIGVTPTEEQYKILEEMRKEYNC